MGEVKNQRTDIYPHNIEKATTLARSLNMTVTEMVNYLVESADVQQLTKITFEDTRTKKSVSVIRTSRGYKPNAW
jgi:hypothetical protein